MVTLNQAFRAGARRALLQQRAVYAARNGRGAPAPAASRGAAPVRMPFKYGVTYAQLDQIPPDRKEEFHLGTPEAGITLALALGSTFTSTITVTQEGDFVATKMVVESDIATGEFVTTAVTINESDRQIQNTEIPIRSMWGTAQLPKILSTPRVFRANSTITIRGTVRVAALAANRNLWFTFLGFKIFGDVQNLNLTQRRG